mgnify:CR=1 FL=1
MQIMKTKSMLAVLCFAAVSFVSCQQQGGDLLVTDLKIADQNIPGTYASQVVDETAMTMTVYEYVLSADGSGSYAIVKYGSGVAKYSKSEKFTWVRGSLAEDLLSIPITLTFSSGDKVVSWTNGSIVDDITTCAETAKATNYGKVIDAFPGKSWASADTTYFINVLHLDSMSYAWKNQRDTLTQVEIDAANASLAAQADEIRAALGLSDDAAVQVTVSKDLGDGTFIVIFPHYVGTVVKYDYPDTLGIQTEMASSLAFLTSATANTGSYQYAYKEYKLNADSTAVEEITSKTESVNMDFGWYIASVVNAKKFTVHVLPTDTAEMDMLIVGFDSAKGELEYNSLKYNIVETLN